MIKPLAVTCGDPCGVGPEITLKAWEKLHAQTPFFLIADYLAVSEIASAQNIKTVQISEPEEVERHPDALAILHNPLAEPPTVGQAQPANADAIIKSIETAVKLVADNRAGAVVTNPINKKVLKDGADFQYPGHTEFLAALGQVDQSYMLLAAPELRVVPVTIHIPLVDVAGALTPDLLSQTISTTFVALQRDFGLAHPRIAVAGLNPHAGEGGLMGTEDQSVILPVIEQFQSQGISITGPHPADTMFHPAARKNYDVAICMYHDQALVPLKTLNFSQGVNTTLGLPFIRTSPDHGTAFDIAGKGIADPDSLIAAITLASQMASARAAYDAAG